MTKKKKQKERINEQKKDGKINKIGSHGTRM